MARRSTDNRLLYATAAGNGFHRCPLLSVCTCLHIVERRIGVFPHYIHGIHVCLFAEVNSNPLVVGRRTAPTGRAVAVDGIFLMRSGVFLTACSHNRPDGKIRHLRCHKNPMAVGLCSGNGFDSVYASLLEIEYGITLHHLAVALNRPCVSHWKCVAILVYRRQRELNRLSGNGIIHFWEQSYALKRRNGIDTHINRCRQCAADGGYCSRAFCRRRMQRAVGINCAVCCAPSDFRSVDSRSILVANRCRELRVAACTHRLYRCRNLYRRCLRCFAIDRQPMCRSLELRHFHPVLEKRHDALCRIGIVDHIGVTSVGIAIRRRRRNVGIDREITVAISAVAVGNEIRDAVGVGLTRHKSIRIPHLVHHTRRLIRIEALQI